MQEAQQAQQAREDSRQESVERGRSWAAACPVPLLEELHRYELQRHDEDLETQRLGRANLRAFSQRHISGGIASNAFVEGALEVFRARRSPGR